MKIKSPFHGGFFIQKKKKKKTLEFLGLERLCHVLEVNVEDIPGGGRQFMGFYILVFQF